MQLYQRQNIQPAHAEPIRMVQFLARRENSRAEHLMQEHVLTNRDVLVQALKADFEASETRRAGSS